MWVDSYESGEYRRGVGVGGGYGKYSWALEGRLKG